MIVVWRIADSCNLACPFCAFDRRLTFRRSEANPDDVLTFANALAMYQSLTGDRVLLSWLGGEPFLWQPLEELTVRVRSLGLDVSATTNGTVLGSPKLRRHICENYRELTISVDGFSDFHDSMRDWHGGFAKLQVWVPLLAKEGTNYLSRIRASTLDRRNPVADCAPGERFLFVDEKGSISPCSFTTADYGIDVRELVSGADIRHLAGRFRDMRDARRSTQCDDCLSTQVCDKFQRPSHEPDALLS